MDKKSLAVAYGAARKRKNARPMGIAVDASEVRTPGVFHPKAIADALRKKKQCLPEDEEIIDDSELEELDLPDEELLETPEVAQEDAKAKKNRVMGDIMRGIQLKKT